MYIWKKTVLDVADKEITRGQMNRYSYVMDPLFSAPTHNHKPQTTTRPPTTHHNHHDEVGKNGIRYALGLTRSIAYRRNCLVNRNPDIVVEMTLNVGIK
jgi:hypothetical protein